MRAVAWLATAALAALPLTLASNGPARAQTAAHAAVAPAQSLPAENTEATAPPSANTTGVAPAPSPEQKSFAGKAIDTVKQVAKSASDIFGRVPCLPSKGGSKSMGSLPHVAGKLAAAEPVTIVAFGSSSTQGYGTSSPEFTYPNRLARQLRRQYPTADIRVVNAGKGGEDAPEMTKRLESSVIDLHPDLVIWQVGTNAVLRNLDPDETARLVEDGVGRIQAIGADIVLVDPQYSPRITSKRGKMPM